MGRSSRWPSRRRSDSRDTARATERATTNLVAVPDGARQLSDGRVVEASVVARLFGIRLLAIDASLVISPAHVKGPSPARGGASVAWIPVTAPVKPHTRSRTIGPGLAAAERFIDEGAASLAASRVTVRSA
jgi:hypothetical protein